MKGVYCLLGYNNHNGGSDCPSVFLFRDYNSAREFAMQKIRFLTEEYDYTILNPDNNNIIDYGEYCELQHGDFIITFVIGYEQIR